MSQLRISLASRHGRAEFFSLLQEYNVDFMVLKGLPEGGIFASGEMLQITGALAPFAAVIVAWLKNRRAHKVILQLKDNNIIHMEATAYSVDEVTKLLEQARSVAVIQTEKDEDADPKHSENAGGQN